jgi:hypothetical protein
MLKSIKLLAIAFEVWRTWESGCGVGVKRGEVTDFRKEALVWYVPTTCTEETPTGSVEFRSS